MVIVLLLYTYILYDSVFSVSLFLLYLQASYPTGFDVARIINRLSGRTGRLIRTKPQADSGENSDSSCQNGKQIAGHNLESYYGNECARTNTNTNIIPCKAIIHTYIFFLRWFLSIIVKSLFFF